MSEKRSEEEFQKQSKELYGKIKTVLDDYDTTLAINVLIIFVAQIAVFGQTPDLPPEEAVTALRDAIKNFGALRDAIKNFGADYQLWEGQTDSIEKQKGH